jgi:hypothetical protein
MSSSDTSTVDPVTLAKATAEIVSLAALDLIGTMQPSRNQSERARAALFLNIVENLNACNILVREGLDTHGALHVRSMLESLVNMTLLEKPNHLKQMYFDKIDGELKIFTELTKDPHLSAESHTYILEKIKELSPEREALRAEGFRKRVISKSIKEANLPFLATSYVTLNSMAHWDLAALSERYESENGNLQVFAKARPSVTVGIAWIAIQIMVMATEAVKEVAKFTDGSYEKEFNRMNQAWGFFLQEHDKISS